MLRFTRWIPHILKYSGKHILKYTPQIDIKRILRLSKYSVSFIKSFQMEVEETIQEEKTVACVTAKDMKIKMRPQFESNPEKYYPTKIFQKIGFHRAQCPNCKHFYWRKSEKAKVCGDSSCLGKYTFIGEGVGIGKEGKKLTYSQAWDTFSKSFSTARIPCTTIQRYPVVARWRNDVDYCAAGIFCFQPYCVTGQLQPPANPLICPQFCVRFNDLDNIGLTGRHYSGFVMLGIQVFNKPDDYKFFKQQTVEFNYRWLTEQLKIDPEQITFTEDIWSGGGNFGPCVQYFVGGLELGNMVFIQYKYFNDGSYDQLSVKVIDVGVGLERVAWLINGDSTSYMTTFGLSFEYLNSKLQVPLDNKVWSDLGPYTCRLDIDEVEDVDKTWKQISGLINLPVEQVKKAIVPIKDLYVILDHTRTALMIINDGGLPSNTGGGSNCRNIIRRVFATLKKNQWWDKLGGIEGLLKLFDAHREDLSKLYGPFEQYKSFGDIIKIQYERWSSTEGGQKKKVQQLVVKKKGKLTLDDWIMAIQTWGVPADVIAQVSNSEVPGNLYNQIATRAEKVGKAQQLILYDTIKYKETQNLYYDNHKLYQFDAEIVAVLGNEIEKAKGKNIILLNRSAFYPTSGGQVNDLGKIIIEDVQYRVYNVDRVGKCFLHYLDKVVTQEFVGKKIQGFIDIERRQTLVAFHSGTHTVFAAARRVLGPHIWQHGAKKTQNYAHIDITHYSSLTQEIEMEIENQANKIILQGHKITKYFEGKSEAEKKFGFSLYQGGIVPGNTIRIVNIEGVDVEACCGTHADNTSEIGWIKIFKSARISDGTLRLYYMAGKKVMKALNEQTVIINNLKELWGVKQQDITGTANRFFNDYKKFEKEAQNQKLMLLSTQVKLVQQLNQQTFILPTIEKLPTLYFSSVNTHLAPIVFSEKTVIFINDSLLFGIVSKPEHLNIETLKDILKKDYKEQQEDFDKKFIVKKGITVGKGKQKIKKDNAVQINYNGKIKDKVIIEFLEELKFQTVK